MIGLSKQTQDATTGAIIINEKPSQSVINKSSPRVSRIATLDGGCVIDHKGYSDSDRTFDIRAELDETDASTVWGLKSETLLNISTREGFFSGVISRIQTDNGELVLQLLTKERLSA